MEERGGTMNQMITEEMVACLEEMASVDGYIHHHPLMFWFTRAGDGNFHWEDRLIHELEEAGLVEWCNWPVPSKKDKFKPRSAMITSKGLELL